MLNLKFALRTLFKTPFVTIVAIVSLALGIGANAAIFSLFNQMLLRPLPVPEPDGCQSGRARPEAGVDSRAARPAAATTVFSYPMFRDLEKVQTVFTGVAAHVSFGANLSARGQTQNGEGAAGVGRLFPGARASSRRSAGCSRPRTTARSASRTSSSSATRTGRRASALDPGVLNQTIIVNGQTMTIVGVAPRGFDGTTLGVQAAGVCADHDARLLAAVQRLRQPAQLLGVPVRATEAGRVDRAGRASRSAPSTTRSSTTSKCRCRRA